MPARFPISPYQQLGGMVYLPRMLDKIRLRQRDEATAKLEDFKATSGLAHRTDLVTFFDYFDADEGRTP